MRQPGGEARLAKEAPAQDGVPAGARQEHLHGDGALQCLVLGEVDDGHAAVPERPLDVVPAFGKRLGQSCSFPCFFLPLCFPLSCFSSPSAGLVSTAAGGGVHSIRRARSFTAA